MQHALSKESITRREKLGREDPGFIALNSRDAEEFLGAGPAKCAGHSLEMTGQRQLAQPVRSCRDGAQHAAPLQRAALGA
jgi:hypothetical protein